MDISSFDDLLQAARAQASPQRLLLVFAGVELPDDATPAQRQRFEAGQGGALVPLMCVDKRPDELASFSALVEESGSLGQPWGMVFAAALSGTGQRAPSSEDAEPALERMVEAIKRGDIGAYIPFDPQGQAVQLG
ncbi:ribonucleotide reductase subunit alpha [Polaromonas sp.]|uniref:ribonucleotide reductase subunit alpha n=1 Tax=Polaromonas sp. TaxID=1869339 RepID=UPI00286D36E6|nr:ribonucleotide reductase subunit alpha [Polaromonas sp.]